VIATCRSERDKEVPLRAGADIGSDDIPAESKIRAAHALNRALEAGWQGLEIAETFPLNEIAQGHEFVEHPTRSGRVIVTI